jgi:hypothetical protein
MGQEGKERKSWCDTNGYKRAETATEGETSTKGMTENDVRTTELEM